MEDSRPEKEDDLVKNDSFSRVRLLAGKATVDSFRSTRVILFGVGGVGSWCAEALIRSGIGCLTLVDYDLICSTNINRQVQATTATVGMVKVHELAHRLWEINPSARIVARQERYKRGSAQDFDLGSFHYVIDAIDSLSAKVDLIISATEAGATVFMSLGASCKIDPTRIRISSLWDSHGCHLGKLVRKRLRRRKFIGNPRCVYSEETLPGLYQRPSSEVDACISPETYLEPENEDNGILCERCEKKRQVNGSTVHVTGTFGFFLAGMVIQDVMKKTLEDASTGKNKGPQP